MMPNERFGEFLVRKNAISREALSKLVTTQRLVREKIGVIAVREGLLSEDEMIGYLSEFLEIPLFKSDMDTIDRGIIQVIPKKMALKANVLPVAVGEAGELILASSGPVPKSVLQTISRIAKKQVRLALTTATRLKRMQNLFFSQAYDTTIDLRKRIDIGDSGFIIELFEKIMVRAVNRNASDIHVEPEKDELVVRFREDGVMHRTETFPYDMASNLAARIKVLAGLDIAEKRKPQDGAFYFLPQALDVQIDGVNVRVSVLPTVHGEKVVLRLLPPHDAAIDLDDLGMNETMLNDFRGHLKAPHGILLVTGPTGSGKSTTLYGALQMLRGETTNITTIEDPVELTVRGVNQTQVDTGEKISFAAALRAILRQDPDIIMVGEIRDAETLSISLRAAITGHLVLSTLHTNDAPSSFSRMNDMGAEPFLVAASVRGVLAQRLVRTVCPHCGVWETISEAEMAMLGLRGEPFPVKRGTGCERCHMGYRGRLGLFELLSMDEKMQKLIMDRANFEEIREYAVRHRGFKTLRQDGIDKIRKGLTSPEEVLRVTIE
jgi:type IV pilus assembly protein PilB